MFVKFFILSWGVTISTFSVIFDWKFLSIFTVMGTFMIIYALIAFWPNLDDLKWELARFLMQLSHNVQYSFQDVRVLDQKYILAKNSEETSQEEFSLICAKTLTQVEACSPEQIMFTDIPNFEIQNFSITSHRAIFYNNRFSSLTILDLGS